MTPRELAELPDGTRVVWDHPGETVYGTVAGGSIQWDDGHKTGADLQLLGYVRLLADDIYREAVRVAGELLDR